MKRNLLSVFPTLAAVGALSLTGCKPGGAEEEQKVVTEAGIYAALHMPSSVFPQTNFPRVVILVDNGVMPGDEMMATITRPIEEAMKDIPGAVTIRPATGRGSAEINVFFNWHVET